MYYLFFGISIKKLCDVLFVDGVKLCILKLFNGVLIDSVWYKVNGKIVGIDYCYVYCNCAAWWLCLVYVLDNEWFFVKFDLFG